MSSTWEATVAAHRAGDHAAAERGYQGLRDHPWALHNLGALYADSGRLAEAESVLRKALVAAPDSAASQHVLSAVLLAQGRYAEGWPLYEARRRTPGTTMLDPVSVWPDLPPEWDGSRPTGRLLVIGEQGFGDQIMFGRFVERLNARGVETVTLFDAELAALFPWSQRARRALPAGVSAWTFLGSLPWRLGATLDDLPPPVQVPVATGGGGGIGVVTRGRSTHVHDLSRSLAGDDAAALLRLGRDLSPDATGSRDFFETAQIVAGLELVISVDTAIAHLAASMGKPTWVLLASRGADWRWLQGRTDSPWYPAVRLFRQAEGEPWSAVLSRVRAALALREGARAHRLRP